MQRRHVLRQQYFREQEATTRLHYLPYISDHITINRHTRVLEIGCGEGGNLLPFARLGRTAEIPAQLRLYLVLVSARPHCRERDGRTAPLREKETGREEKIFSRLVKKTSCRLFTKKTHIRNYGRAYRDLRRIC